MTPAEQLEKLAAEIETSPRTGNSRPLMWAKKLRALAAELRAKCPRCGGETVSTGHGPYCPKPTCKWGWMDGTELRQPRYIRPTLTFGDGDYSCASCGVEMDEPCVHWRQFLVLNAAPGATGQAREQRLDEALRYALMVLEFQNPYTEEGDGAFAAIGMAKAALAASPAPKGEK